MAKKNFGLTDNPADRASRAPATLRYKVLWFDQQATYCMDIITDIPINVLAIHSGYP